jgi:hypothetical protein
MDTYDHINEYINKRVKDKEARELVSDFAILWNQYERTVFEGEHHIRGIKDKINQYSDITERPQINVLYDRFEKYLKSRNIKFEYEDIKRAYNIRIKKDNPKRKGDLYKDELEEAINNKSSIAKTYLLMIIAAKIRNNMFHGTKGPWELKENKELFKICNELLMCILEATCFKDQ